MNDQKSKKNSAGFEHYRYESDEEIESLHRKPLRPL